MAGQWRIRHKLMLGLGLVVVVMGLLLVGTLQGLTSYRTSMKQVESKVAEQSRATDFKQAIHELERIEPGEDRQTQFKKLYEGIKKAQFKLQQFKDIHQDTVQRGRDLPNDYHIPEVVKGLEETLAKFKREVDEVAGTFEFSGGPDAKSPRQVLDPGIKLLGTDADNLEHSIYAQFYQLGQEASRQSTFSLWMVGTTSTLSLLLMAGLLRFFYQWVFNPVRDLMLGVSQVARGKFEHTIVVKSGDEMQDLAAAFNIMTGRLRDIYHDLARQVNERSRQLVRSERLASVGFLAAGVAHEINNPLASIAFCSEALEARLSEALTPGKGMPARPADPEVIFKYLKMIQQEAFRCKEITQRLLEFSRSSERRRELTDLGEVIQSVLDITQHLQSHRGKDIVFNPSARVVAWVNAQEIKSVVLNLVVNALDSMDEGGILTIHLQASDERAEMMFQDTGCGMTPEVLENIFEPFYTQSRTGKGTGLGLTISHRIVTGHGGEIEASSVGPGQGSTFIVRLPLQPGDESQGTKDPETETESPEQLFRKRRAA